MPPSMLHILLFLACIIESSITVNAQGYRLPIQAHHARPDTVLGAYRRIRPHNVQSPLLSPSSSSLPITQSYIGLFNTVNISIGTPAQEFRALLDIAWEDLFVPSKECTAERPTGFCEAAWNRYDSSKSSTSSPLHERAEWIYAALILEGNQVKDTVNVAGIQVADQAFLNIDSARPQAFLAIHDWEAVLGLNRPHSSPPDNNLQKPSIWQNMLDRHLLDNNVFSLKLPQNTKDEGELLLGAIDPAYADHLTELPLSHLPASLKSEASSWHVEAHSLTMSDIHEDFSGFHAFFETSWPFISLPAQLTDRILDKVGAQGGLQWVDCDTRASLPSLTLRLGKHKTEFTLSPWDYITEVVHPSRGTACAALFIDAEMGDENSGGIVLGATFLRSYYAVFDVDAPSVSLAKLSRGEEIH